MDQIYDFALYLEKFCVGMTEREAFDEWSKYWTSIRWRFTGDLKNPFYLRQNTRLTYWKRELEKREHNLMFGKAAIGEKIRGMVILKQKEVL